MYVNMDKIKELLNTKTSCRSFSSWAKLISFYAILYLFIAAFWIVYITIFFQIIDERKPYLTLSDSIIGQNPGLAIRPRPPKSHISSSLIHFKSSSVGNWQYWAENLNEYIKPYHELESGAGQHAQGDCNAFGERDPSKFCPFEPRHIPNECSEAQNYSYHLGKPCILVKLNRIYGWKPETYSIRPQGYPVQAPFNDGHIQITCEGRSNVDKENIGPLDYYPQGIEAKYFPFTNQPGYQSPFVMVHFKNPKPGVLISVECKAWAKNIVHDRMLSQGQVNFELLID